MVSNLTLTILDNEDGSVTFQADPKEYIDDLISGARDPSTNAEKLMILTLGVICSFGKGLSYDSDTYT